MNLIDINKVLSGKGALFLIYPTLQMAALWVATLWIDPTFNAACWIWIIALLIIGMTHGSLDSHIYNWIKNKKLKPLSISKLYKYISIMLISLCFFYSFPLITTLLFFTLTGIHFGEADRVHVLESFNHPMSFPRSCAWLRGAAVVSFPCMYYPAQTWEPFGLLAGKPFNSQIEFFLTVFGVVFILVTASVAFYRCLMNYRHLLAGPFFYFLMESIIAFVWFITMPPMFAIGGYFLTVHATKHMLRLAKLWGNTGDNYSLILRLVKLHVCSLHLWVPATMMTLIWASFLSETFLTSIAVASIGFYLISTLPHHILVGKIPLQQP